MNQSQQPDNTQRKQLPLPVLVLAVFALVIGILLLPAVFATRHHHDPLMRRETGVRSLAMVLTMYAGDHEWVYPSRDQWSETLIASGYCQAEDFVSIAAEGDDVSFVFVPGPCDSDRTQILVYEHPGLFQKGVVVGFRDTHTEVVDHETFERMLAEQLGTD